VAGCARANFRPRYGLPFARGHGLKNDSLRQFIGGGAMHKRKVISILGGWVLAAMLASTALAQGTGRVNGEVLDKDGKPFADQTLTFKNPDTGQVYTEKTDKNGKFVQLGMKGGIYIVTFPSINYTEKFQVLDGQENAYKLDLKALAAATLAAHPEDAKKKEESEDKFKQMKQHFDAGVGGGGGAQEFGDPN
jgi:hypothetical protein